MMMESCWVSKGLVMMGFGWRCSFPRAIRG